MIFYKTTRHKLQSYGFINSVNQKRPSILISWHGYEINTDNEKKHDEDDVNEIIIIVPQYCSSNSDSNHCYG